MHDANGKLLQKGDVVLIPAVITELQPGEDFCNVSVESVFGRRPCPAKERIYAINTGVMLRYNQTDTIGYSALDDVRPAESAVETPKEPASEEKQDDSNG